jgi:hypothetical protein
VLRPRERRARGRLQARARVRWRRSYFAIPPAPGTQTIQTALVNSGTSIDFLVAAASFRAR